MGMFVQILVFVFLCFFHKKIAKEKPKQYYMLQLLFHKKNKVMRIAKKKKAQGA